VNIQGYMTARRYQVYLSCAVERNIFQHEKRNSPSDHVISFLFYDIFTIHNDVLAIFRTFTTEDFHSLVEGQTNISLHSRTIAKKTRRCFVHTPKNLTAVKGTKKITFSQTWIKMISLMEEFRNKFNVLHVCKMQ